MNNEFKKIQLSSETRYILESAGVGGTSTGGGATLGTALGGMKRRIPTRENDHEIEMASKELSSIIRNSRELLDILKDYSEQTGLEAWQQSKITKATDYLNSVLQSIDRVQQAPAMKDNNQNDENVSEGKLDELHDDLKTLSNEEFEKEYGMTKAEAREKFSGKDKPNWIHEGSEKKGLYYYVNKRKKAGTSRPAGHPKAPTAQAWKDAAKTAKKEGVAEGFLNEFAPGGDDDRPSRSLSQVIDYIKKTYPVYKKYILDSSYRYKNLTVVANRVKQGKINDEYADPMVRAINYLGMGKNSLMSGIDSTHIGREDWWHTYENNKNAVLHFVGQNQGWIIIAGKTGQNLADAVQVFRDSGILPDLMQAKQNRQDKAASRLSALSNTPLKVGDMFGTEIANSEYNPQDNSLKKVNIGWNIWKVLEFTKTGKIKAQKVKSPYPNDDRVGEIKLFNPKGNLIRNERGLEAGREYKNQQDVAEGSMGNVKDTELKNIDPDNHNKGEGDFVKNQLHTIKRVVTHLENSIGNEEDLPDWVQSEIAKATDKIVNVMDYSISKKEQDIGSDSLMKEQGVAEGSKDTKPGWMLRQMRDKNDPAFQKIANKQAAMAALKQPSKNNQQGVAGDSRYDDEYGPTAREKWLQQQAYEKAYNKK